MKTELLLFDLDGTLVDSKRDIVLSVNRTFSALGMPILSEALIGDGIGNGSEHLFRQLVGSHSDATFIKRLLALFQDLYSQHLTENTILYPGILDVLTYYARIPKVIITNKGQTMADRLVNELGLRSHFEGVFGIEAFPTRKPDPGPLLQVCSQWGVTPSHAIFVGDSVIDITAAKRAGTNIIGVLYGYGNETAIRQCEPTFVVNTASELVGLI